MNEKQEGGYSEGDLINAVLHYRTSLLSHLTLAEMIAELNRRGKEAIVIMFPLHSEIEGELKCEVAGGVSLNNADVFKVICSLVGTRDDQEEE